MRLLPRSSIVTRTLRSFGIASAVIYLLSMPLLLEWVRVGQIREADAKLEDTLEWFERPLARSLWNYDIEQLRSEAEALARMDVIHRLEVFDERSRQVVDVGHEDSQVEADRTVERPLTYGEGRAAGLLRIQVSYGPVLKQYWRRALVVASVHLLNVVLLAAVLFYLLHRNVIAGLVALAREVKALGPA
jgi:hypothetical protein